MSLVLQKCLGLQVLYFTLNIFSKTRAPSLLKPCRHLLVDEGKSYISLPQSECFPISMLRPNMQRSYLIIIQPELICFCFSGK